MSTQKYANDRKIILGGMVAGISQVLAGHPFDTIKVKHIHNLTLQPKNSLYNTVTTLNKNGFKGFYRGISSPLIGSVIMNIQIFYTYNYIKKVLDTKSCLLAGGLTGLTLAAVETPADLIKIKFQTTKIKPTYSSTIKEIGFKNLYRGFGITSLRNFTSVGLFFWGYENTTKKFNDRYIGSFCGGAVAGFMCWGFNYPLDNIKTQIQSSPNQLTVKSILRNVVATKKYKSLWTGFGPCMVRAVCVNPFIFLGYELGNSLI